MPYWFNVNTQQVEDDRDTEAKDHLMGPYATREEAAGALAQAAENTRRWDEDSDD